ncbi:MAG TPA: long-chain fatty acid--CoA ligase [Candidatus Agrococcus pullicola]|uniref:Long-chain fatty acid--CoA ligase n=1 Tax=Candidatus Agrococcus pullicola TaxID=2838429 RepID=A0A9D1YX81_9MICO|nr:long-chain fatty acid--CoA ligase [Candidatus Agrococcus pullicola]
MTVNRRYTFHQLWRTAEAAAAGLYLHVLGRRPRMIVIVGEGEDMVIALLAAHRLGLDVMPVDPGADPQVLRRSVPADALLVHEQDKPDWHRGPAVSTARLSELAATSGSSLGRTKRRSRIILLSSGRSGAARAHVTRPIGFGGVVQLTALHRRIGISERDRVLACTPLQHGHGLQLLASCLLTGAKLVYAPSSDASELLDLMLNERITVASGKPSEFERMASLLEESRRPAPPLRRIVCSSEPLEPELVERMNKLWGPVIMNSYGMTETGTVALATPEQVLRHPGTVGKPLPGVEIGIVGSPIWANAEGRIWVRGGNRTVITGDFGRIRQRLIYVDGTEAR